MTLLERARDFATKAHADAGCTYGVHDFDYHLNAVDQVLLRFGHDDEVLRAIAWLHDVVEDTPVTTEQLLGEFHLQVMSGVAALTDVLVDEDGNPLPNRRARQQRTYAKLRRYARDGWKSGWTPHPWPEIVNVKLADRIANVEASMVGINSRHFGMYVTEHPFFCREVGAAGGDPKMWAHLDRLVTKNPLASVAKRINAWATDYSMKFDGWAALPRDLKKLLEELHEVMPR